MMSTGKCVFLGVCASMAMMASGSAFLKANPDHHTAARVSEQDIQTTMLAEVEGSLGTAIGSQRVIDMKAIISPIYTALPKNEHGFLDHVTVKYVLHRVFIQRHGWSIKGLDNDAGAGRNSSATGVLKDQVPAFIQDLFEKRLGGRGLGLSELSVFAATIEHLIHNEAVGRLGSVLSLHEFLPTGLLTESQADEVLDTYMMVYILSEDLSKLTLETATKLVRAMPRIYPGWAETQKFVREVTHSTIASQGTAADPTAIQQISFALLVKIAETVGERFGKFQNAECKDLKDKLMQIEDRGTGRVRLADFYKPIDGAWNFQESSAYLRQLGNLDESIPNDPRVMIPNYLTSQTNCISSSDYYSICCIDECEDLFVHLEKDIAAPEATSARILDLISSLPSSSVNAPRSLSATLRTRLEQIASQHGGSVQLHSRLFAQWMHHAYPRECPYPHMSGTTIQENPLGWSDGMGATSTASKEEIEQFCASSNSTRSRLPADDEDVHDLMMWSAEEELLVVRPTLQPVATSVASGVRSMVMFAALSSVAVVLVRRVTTPSGLNDGPQKFMV